MTAEQSPERPESVQRSLAEADLEAALREVRARWRSLSEAALDAADEVRQTYAWEGHALEHALRHILADAEQAA